MTQPRCLQSATLLFNGEVLVAGGVNSIYDTNTATVATAEIYNPSTGEWTATDSLNVSRASAATFFTLTSCKVQQRPICARVPICFGVIPVIGPRAVQGPYIIEGAVAELQDFRRQITEPKSTLVIAPHGLEWWAGYFLDTAVGMSMKDASSSRYSRVLVLRHTINFKPRPPRFRAGGRRGGEA
jgi:hypothetical protein